MPLLDHAGEILSETTGARRGGSGFWGDEIQVFIIGDLVKMVPVLQQLPAQVLVHLLRGTKWGSAGWTHSHALWGDASSPCAEPRGVRGTREPVGTPQRQSQSPALASAEEYPEEHLDPGSPSLREERNRVARKWGL